MVNLSVTIITLNEEKNIRRCLDSIKNVADDIVVLDSFSSDKTKEICLTYPNLTFVERIWEGYGKAKNFAASLTKNDFILSIDADEALSEELTKSILKSKENLSGCYYFNRLNNYCGKWVKHSGWYPDEKTRIYSKKEARWSEDLVHEELLADKLSLKKLKGDLLHYSIDSISTHIKTINKYSDLAALSSFNKNQKASLILIIFHPFVKFFKIYILKKGFLDGYYGFIISVLSGFSKFLKYVKLYELQRVKTGNSKINQ